MSRIIVGSVVGLMGAIELIALWLLLPAARWQTTETRGAVLGILLALLVTGAFADRSARAPISQAAVWTTWPPVAVAFAWAVGGAVIVYFAVELGGKWIIGVHALAATACGGVWLITLAAGRHVDATGDLPAGDRANGVLLVDTVARARVELSRAQLPPGGAQRIRTLLNRVSTLPRRPLPMSLESQLTQRLQALVAGLSEGDASLDDRLRNVEDAVEAAKRA